MLCLANGAGLGESVELTLGGAVRSLSSAPRLGETMDKKTAAAVAAAANILLGTHTPPERLALSALLAGVFALPVG